MIRLIFDVISATLFDVAKLILGIVTGLFLSLKAIIKGLLAVLAERRKRTRVTAPKRIANKK